MTYWIDTNALIQCSNKIYKFQRWPEFWNFLAVQFEQETIRSSHFVYKELVAGNDFLAQWCKSRKETALNTYPTEDVQRCATLINDFVEADARHLPQHKAEFFRGADYWLIAHAMADNGIVVTHETEREFGKIKVNSVCTRMNIPCIDIYRLQDRLNFDPRDYRENF